MTEELPSTLQPLGVHAVVGHIDRLVEGVRGGEVVREQKVEYSPQLVEVVLERRAGEEQSVVAREARERTMQDAIRPPRGGSLSEKSRAGCRGEIPEGAQ